MKIVFPFTINVLWWIFVVQEDFVYFLKSHLRVVVFVFFWCVGVGAGGLVLFFCFFCFGVGGRVWQFLIVQAMDRRIVIFAWKRFLIFTCFSSSFATFHTYHIIKYISSVWFQGFSPQALEEGDATILLQMSESPDNLLNR